MGHIFISYSHKDKKYVEKLEKKLIDEGFDVWVDHRIDYGSQWPREIEKALDSCDAFIVVVSENAFESEWVQNEVARAIRKMKPLFPVLFSGDIWLSIETTQAVEVRDGSLPHENFYEQLGQVAQRGLVFSTAKWLFVNDWPIYHNTKYKFSIRYPEDGEISSKNSENVTIRFPVIRGTDLQEKYLLIKCSDDTTLPSLEKENRHWTVKKVIIDEMEFLCKVRSDAGMGKYVERVTYSASHENININITLVLIKVSHYPYLPKLITRVDLESEREIIKFIAGSFKGL